MKISLLNVSLVVKFGMCLFLKSKPMVFWGVKLNPYFVDCRVKVCVEYVIGSVMGVMDVYLIT